MVKSFLDLLVSGTGLRGTCLSAAGLQGTRLRSVAALCIIVLLPSLVQAQSSPAGQASAGQAPAPNARQSYQVLSVKPQEVIVRITPQYALDTVLGLDGEHFTQMTFDGGIVTDSAGAPQREQLPLFFLVPNRTPVSVAVVSQSLEVVPGTKLAPVPVNRKVTDGLIPEYKLDAARYFAPAKSVLYTAERVEPFRTAYSERILVSPIQYDAVSETVTRVKSLVLRISFGGVPTPGRSVVNISSAEADFFRTIFINGSVTSLYAARAMELPQLFSTKSITKNAALSSSPLSTEDNGGQWLQITTTDAGVYHISAQDLANNGISGPIDPNSVELLGLGGEMLSEAITDSCGAWQERGLEVHSSDGAVTDLYFYASGVSVWKYSPYLRGTDGLFHNINYYATAGHFLLKVGGTPVDQPLRIVTQLDSNIGNPTASTQVMTAFCREIDRTLEVDNVGREMLDNAIPRSDAPPLTFSMSPPGYTGSNAVLRVAFDSRIGGSRTSDTGSVAVQVDNQLVETIRAIANSGNDADRNWSQRVVLAPSLSSPLTMDLAFTSSDITGNAWLDFIELVYSRGTDIGSQSIPFFLIDTIGTFQYQFTNASGGEVWDVTNTAKPVIEGMETGGTIGVTLAGQSRAMRQFIAFSSASILSPSIAKASTPTLRSGLCQTGVEEIIITPSAFLTDADSMAAIRQRGGQATEPT
ncbi:MAG TPA: hypothetical protein VGM92_13195, partial [Candidatus Kapabacteria bacterium]